MRKFLFFLLIIPVLLIAQTIEYHPNQNIKKTVAKNYYNTDFIYIKNTSDKTINLEFELVANTFLSEWSETICTNVQCFNSIPKAGILGSLNPGEEAYISFNFSANEALGSGFVKFLISSPDDISLKDTIRFEYTVTEDGKIEAGPWARINYGAGVLTVLLENPNLEANMKVVHLDGKVIFDSSLDAITSIPLRNYASGLYLVYIIDERQRIMRERVLQP